MNCPNCGAENPDGNRFCESCGAEINAAQNSGNVGASDPMPNVTNSADTVSGGNNTAYDTGYNQGYNNQGYNNGYTYGQNNSAPYGQPNSAPYGQQNYYAPEKKDQTTVCILALVFGIVSFFCDPFYAFTIAAVVLGIVGIANNGSKKGLAIAGLICGICAIPVQFIIDICTMGLGVFF